MLEPRKCLPLIAVLLCVSAHGQDWDIYLSGSLKDARSGQPIPFGVVEVFDELDTGFTASSMVSASGEYLRELYSGHMAAGGYYVVEFMAAGYQSRMALFDVAQVEKKKGEATAWRITMNVELEPMEPGMQPVGALLGYCEWQRSTRTLRWSDEKSRKAFPIDRYVERRILAHGAAIDSVYGLKGLMVDGVVRDQWTNEPLADVRIRVDPVVGKDSVYRTDNYGYYVMVLPHDAVYRMEFSKSGMVAKRVDVDVTSIPEEVQTTGFRATVDIRLFNDLPDEDLSFLQEPMGRMKYDQVSRNMVWDMAISKPVMERLDVILKRHAPATGKGR